MSFPDDPSFPGSAPGAAAHHDDSHAMDQQPTSPIPAPHGDGPHGAATHDADAEAALSALMRQAVDGLRGSPDALERLRRAVPARRRRRRQARVGAVAALVLVGMAVPALIRVAGTGGGSTTAASGLADTHTPAPGEQGHTRPWDGSVSPTAQTPPGSGSPGPHHPAEGGPTTGASSAPTAGQPAPDCTAAQLGNGSSGAAAPDADGRVYGWFRVVNVSGTPCTVPDGGVVRAVVSGEADPARVAIVAHQPGDPATGLPSPETAGPLVLSPGQDYEVAFAWVPDSGSGPGGCTATTPPASPTPTATATATATSDPTTGPGAPGAAGGGTEVRQAGEQGPGTPPPSSIALDHTPAAGAPVVDGPVIQGACAGTVYTTQAIPEPVPTATTATPTP